MSVSHPVPAACQGTHGTVTVFLPGREGPDGTVECPDYDDPRWRADMDQAFAAVDVPWRWEPVTRAGLRDRVLRARAQDTTVFNLCDGDETLGVPGVDVVRALERHRVVFTGADSLFYDLTSCRDRMKRRLDAAGVPQPAWTVAPRHAGAPIPEVGYPAIVKPDVSGGSCGIELASVVQDITALTARVARLRGAASLHGRDFRDADVVVEEYIDGPEFSVLVTGHWTQPASVRVYPPVRRFIAGGWPEILTYERNWERWEHEVPPATGEPYWHAAVPAELLQPIMDLARRAYMATGGIGYGRVDLRQDAATGVLKVLEVNANCGLSSDPHGSTVGGILTAHGMPLSDLLAEVLALARVRHGDRPRRVVVLFPCRDPADTDCGGYTEEGFKSEADTALRDLDLETDWRRVHHQHGDPQERTGPVPPDGVLNFCDGDDRTTPGVSVVESLSAQRVRYTGADAAFYRVSTSKLGMKSRLKAAGVSTPAAVAYHGDLETFVRDAQALGYPYILKPDVSAGSYGIDRNARVDSADQARRQVVRLCQGLHGVTETAGIFAEAFVTGREFTVLVTGDAAVPDTVLVYTPLEYRFADALPEQERFLFFDRRYEYDAPAACAPRYEYVALEGSLGIRARAVARAAYEALGGYGYARVDLRYDTARDQVQVLEVNANCGIAGDPSISTVGAILQFSRENYRGLLARILGLAERAR